VTTAGGGSPPRPPLEFPTAIQHLHINVGPNLSPILPPADDPATAVLAVEAQLGVAATLASREGVAYPGRFFVIPAALAGGAAAGGFATFRHYNDDGQSSSLSPARDAADWAAKDARRNRTVGVVSHVPVLSLARLLDALPPSVTVPLLKTDAQGWDLSIIQSAGRSLRRAERIMAEVFRGDILYDLPPGVTNDLDKGWVPYMRSLNYTLAKAGPGKYTDAVFERVGEP